MLEEELEEPPVQVPSLEEELEEPPEQVPSLEEELEEPPVEAPVPWTAPASPGAGRPSPGAPK